MFNDCYVLGNLHIYNNSQNPYQVG